MKVSQGLDMNKMSVGLSRFLYLINFLLIFSLFISKGGLVRIFSYINIVALMYFYVSDYVVYKKIPHIHKVLLIPVTYVLLDMLAMQQISFANEYRKIILATFFGIGLYWIAEVDHLRRGFILNSIILLIVIYIAFQFVSILMLDKPYGTTKNPHYLALYSVFAILMGTFYFYEVTTKIRFIVPVSLIFLVGLVLYTSSRPAWIALFLASLVSIFFLKEKVRNVAIALIILLPVVLFFTNIGDFGNRLSDLLMHISTEERVTIWRDTWAMQMTSTYSEWSFGHGITSFEEDFKRFSTYHLQGNDFTMPHNSVLEVLYATGLVGLSLFFLIYFYITRELIGVINKSHKYRRVGILLLSILIVNFTMGLITVKWFTHFNSYVLAGIMGLLLFFKRIRR